MSKESDFYAEDFRATMVNEIGARAWKALYLENIGSPQARRFLLYGLVVDAKRRALGYDDWALVHAYAD